MNIKEFLKSKFNKKNFPVPRIRAINRITVLSLFSYLHVLVIVSLIFSRKNQFIKFHAKQGLILFAFWSLAMFSLYVPLLPWLFALLIVFFILFGIVNVFLSRERFLPVIGRFADKI